MGNGARTVKELMNSLGKYPKNLTVTLFDSELGDSPVAFKSEKAESNGKGFKWITIYPSEEPKQTTVESILAVLTQCPERMIISTKDSNGQYSDLYTSVESMKGDFTQTQWVVISDRLSYEKYFAEKEPTNRDTAINKLKVEIGKEPDTNQRMIFGWLLKQTDDLLFNGILKSDRTMKNAIQFAVGKAKEQAKNAQMAIVDDETVYSWIYEYFTAEKVTMPSVTGKMTTGKKKKKAEKQKEEEQKKGGEEQVSLF